MMLNNFIKKLTTMNLCSPDVMGGVRGCIHRVWARTLFFALAALCLWPSVAAVSELRLNVLVKPPADRNLNWQQLFQAYNYQLDLRKRSGNETFPSVEERKNFEKGVGNLNPAPAGVAVTFDTGTFAFGTPVTARFTAAADPAQLITKLCLRDESWLSVSLFMQAPAPFQQDSRCIEIAPALQSVALDLTFALPPGFTSGRFSLVAYDNQGLSTTSPIIPVVRTDYSGAQLTLASASEMNKGDKTSGQLSLVVDGVALSSVLGDKASYTLTSANPSVISVGLTRPNIADIEVPTNAPVSGDTPVQLNFSVSLNGVTLASGNKTITVKDQIAYRWGVPAYSYSYVSPSGTWTLEQARRGYKIKVTSYALDSAGVAIDGDDQGYSFSALGSNLTLVNGSKRNEKIITINGADELYMHYLSLPPETLPITPTNFMDVPALTLSNWSWDSGASGTVATEVFGTAGTPQIRRGDSGKTLTLTFNETNGGLGGTWSIRSRTTGLTATIQSQTPTSLVLHQVALSDSAALAASIELRRTDTHGNILDVTLSGSAGEKIVQAKWATPAFTFNRVSPLDTWGIISIYEGYRARIKLQVETDETTPVPVSTGNFNLTADDTNLVSITPTATAGEFEVEFKAPGTVKLTGHYQDASGQATPLSTLLRPTGFVIKEMPVYTTVGSLNYVRQAGLSANKQEAAPTILANKQGTVLKGVALYPGDDGLLDVTFSVTGTAIALNQWKVVSVQGLEATPALNLTPYTGQEKITLDLKIANSAVVADGYKINLLRKDSHGNEYPVTIEGQLLDYPALSIGGLTNLTMTDSELQNLTLGIVTSASVTASDFNWQYSLTDITGAYANNAISVTPNGTEPYKAVVQVGSISADGEVELKVVATHKQLPAFKATATSRVVLDVINITASFDFNAAVSNLLQPDRPVASMAATKLLAGDVFTVKARVLDENGNDLTLNGQTSYQWKVFFTPTGGSESQTGSPTGNDVGSVSVPTQIAGTPIDDGSLRVELKASYSYGSKISTSTVSKSWAVNKWPQLILSTAGGPTSLTYQNSVKVGIRALYSKAVNDGDVDFYWRVSAGAISSTSYNPSVVSLQRNYGTPITYTLKTISKTGSAYTETDITLLNSSTFEPVTYDVILYSHLYGVYSRDNFSRVISYTNNTPVVNSITVTPLEGALATGKKVRLKPSISDPDNITGTFECIWALKAGSNGTFSNLDPATCETDFLIQGTETVLRFSAIDDIGIAAAPASPERTRGTSAIKEETIIANSPPEFFDNSPLVTLSDFGSGMPSQMRLVAFDRDGDQLRFDILPFDISGDNNCDFSKPLAGGETLINQNMTVTQEDVSVSGATVKKQVAEFTYTHVNSNSGCLKVVVKDSYGQITKNISLASNLLPEFRRVFIDGVYTAGRGFAGPQTGTALPNAVFKEEAAPPQLVVFANITDMDSTSQADLSFEAKVTKDGASASSDFDVTWATEISTLANFSTYLNTRCDSTGHFCFNGKKTWNGVNMYGIFARVIITLDTINSPKTISELDSLLGTGLIVELLAKDAKGGSRAFKVKIPRFDALSFRTNIPFWASSSAQLFTPATLGDGYQLRLPYFLESNTDLGNTQNTGINTRVALSGPSTETAPLTVAGIESHGYYKFRINEPAILNWYDSTVFSATRMGAIYKLNGSSLQLIRDSLNNNATDTMGNSNRHIKLQTGGGGFYVNGYDWRQSLPIPLDAGTYYIRRMFNKATDVVMTAGNYFSVPMTGFCPATGKVDNSDIAHNKGLLPNCFSPNRPSYTLATVYSYPTAISRNAGKAAVEVLDYSIGHPLQVQDADYSVGQDAKLKIAYITANGAPYAVTTDFKNKIYIDPSKIGISTTTLRVSIFLEDESGLISGSAKSIDFSIVN